MTKVYYRCALLLGTLSRREKSSQQLLNERSSFFPQNLVKLVVFNAVASWISGASSLDLSRATRVAAADNQELVSDVPSETPGTETLSKCPAEKERQKAYNRNIFIRGEMNKKNETLTLPSSL